ncbi:MAG: hypothetical protein AMDU1_APLC00021G0028 [Thermoplasmatales archaeon A-plasma]|jgi:cellulose synthase/poly-beta-1,6-N-acetylglucosamine synthase-like glycosyltransferase|nr:MAG: hypothetical protein AMDU1_APLC00021G0028 [Thermoplasmatales archaeon A-plasma]
MVLSPLPPLAVGFFGLGTGYYVWGGWEFFRIPRETTEKVNKTLGQWGIWMPGFMQFLTGTYLFLGLTIFNAFQTSIGYTALYMAALAFTAYGVHWFALGINKYVQGDPTVDGYMAIAFLWISITGAFVFFKSGDVPVGVLFVLLALVYISDIPASLMRSASWTRIKGFWHLVTGTWLMYLMFAAATTFALGMHLPL